MAIALVSATINPLFSQQVRGQINDSSNSAISGVFLLLDGEVVSQTNSHGVFTLADKYQLPLQIVLSHPEYIRTTVTISENNKVFTLSALPNTQNLDEVIISSVYQKESKVIVPTTKISSRKLEEYSPIDLVSAINETPGIYIQSGALNTNRIVIRGVGSRTPYGTNKIRAYFNGIPITNGAGETTIDIFDPEDIESLEIVKGPKATQYGTNLGGTILLNSKQIEEGKTRLKNSFTIGSFGLIKNGASVSTANKKLSFHINYDHLESDGFRENSNYNRNTVLFTSNYKINAKNEVGVLLNYIDYYAQIPSSIGEVTFEENPDQAAVSWAAAKGYEDNKQVLAGINYTYRFSDNFSNTTSIFYNYLDHYEPRPFNILDEYTYGYGARTLFAQDFFFLTREANFTLGGEYYTDQYNWQTIENLYETNNGNGSLEGDLQSDNQEKRDNLNVFATITLPITDKLKTQIGLNFNKTSYRFVDDFNVGENNKNADRDFDPIFAPNLNITYQFTSFLSAYFNFSRGFNYPSIEETLTPEGVINPDLGAETGLNYEVGGELYLFKRKLKAQLSAYLLDVNNLLVADRVGEDQYIGRNAGETEHKGIELSILYTQPFLKGKVFAPYLNLELSDNRFVDFVDGSADYSGNKLTGVPSLKLNGGAHFRLDKLGLNVNFVHIGEMPLDDSNTIYSDKYTVFNAKLSYLYQIGGRFSVEVNAGINNFTNEAYASSVLINAVGFGNSKPRYYYPGMPINWFSGLKLNYQI